MSTNSINQFSVEDDGSVTESPPTSTKKCTRTTPCSQPNCGGPDCGGCPGTASIGHVRDISDALETMTTSTTIPPNHWIIKLTKAFKVAIQNQDHDELEHLNERYKQRTKTLSDDEIDVYDRTEIMQLNRDANELLATFSTTPIQSRPYQTPFPPPCFSHTPYSILHTHPVCASSLSSRSLRRPLPPKPFRSGKVMRPKEMVSSPTLRRRSSQCT